MSSEMIVHEGAEVPLSREKIELIKQTVAKGATDLELDLFLHACKRTGLDPLMKQVYAIKRWSAADKREVMSFQTGIDGYRLIADRTGRYAGSDEPSYEVGADGFPSIASVTIYKMISGQRCAFSASARWTEYVQLTREGQPTSMWKKMPFLMLGKCAEALALRKAFPAELSGIYTHEEMQQADNETRSPIADNKAKAQAAIAELRGEGVAVESSRSAPATSAAESVKAPATADTLTPVKDLTISGWGTLLGGMENDPDLADLLTMVKEQCGLKSLAYPKVSPKDRVDFLTALQAAAQANGLGPRVKALGL